MDWTMWIKYALWFLVFVQVGIAIYHDWRDNDVKCIKHYLFAFALMWAISADMS
jgi:hypothetical protein